MNTSAGEVSWFGEEMMMAHFELWLVLFCEEERENGESKQIGELRWGLDREDGVKRGGVG